MVPFSRPPTPEPHGRPTLSLSKSVETCLDGESDRHYNRHLSAPPDLSLSVVSESVLRLTPISQRPCTLAPEADMDFTSPQTPEQRGRT